MGQVGRFVSNPRAGAYCNITLDSGEKIIVNHDKGGTKGGQLTIEKSGWLGLGGQRVFACNLDSPDARAAMVRLTAGVPDDSARATPLGAFVEHVKDCKSVEEVKEKCSGLISGH